MIAGLSPAAWLLILASVGIGLAIEVCQEISRIGLDQSVAREGAEPAVDF